MKLNKRSQTKKQNSFWDTDLKDIEAEFLDKGQKITDLPTHLDRRVPHQGSVLLDKVDQVGNDKSTSCVSRFFSFLK